MQTLVGMLSAATCFVFVAVITWLVVSPKVDDGLVVKAGLILSDLGFLRLGWKLWSGLGPSDMVDLERTILLINAGAFVVIGGWLWRVMRNGHVMRRHTDWSALQDTRPMPEEPAFDLDQPMEARR